jgi:tRNA U38,U39,U40 pseudouridine synthase TruA
MLRRSNWNVPEGEQLGCFVERLNALLGGLQGQRLDYYAISSKKLRSVSSTECSLATAEVHVLSMDSHPVALGVVFRADRFLRRMVRVLVATTLQLALLEVVEHLRTDKQLEQPISFQSIQTESHLSGPEDDNPLLQCIRTRDRRSSAKAAPPDGLVYLGASFLS